MQCTKSKNHAAVRQFIILSNYSLTHLTTLTLRSLPTELGGLGIRRYSGLVGETACLRGRTVFYEFAERFAPELLAGAKENFWSPIVLGGGGEQALDGGRGSVQS